MSKKSRRRNRALGVIAGLMGAKALGMFGTKGTVTGAAGKDKRLFTDIKPKKFTKPVGPQKVNTKSFPRLKVDSIGNVTKDGVTSVTKNTKTKFLNLDSSKGTGPGIYQAGKKVSGLNQKAINVLKDGKIQTGGKTYADKGAYRKAMDAKRSAMKKTGFSKSTNKKNPGLFGFTFDKPLFKKGSMIKARGGGMARMKPTKMY
ncbi:hypothetical protein HTVC023P_gp30 [Pelagibacter phage HTVC023P]|nr:hypothetical protein HTVC023P_gp30 [Pelagibacter phage HTVC023P]